MSISAVNAATSAYGVANQSSKVTSSNQSGNVAQTTQADSVSLSSEAIQQSRAEQYKAKDSVDLFNDWLDSGLQYSVLILYRENGTEDELLPENKPLLDELKTKVSDTNNSEQRMILSNKIDSLLGWGNEEIFNSEADLDKRFDATIESNYLQQAYLKVKYGDPNGEVPSELAERVADAKENWSKIRNTPLLSEFTGIEMKKAEGEISMPHNISLNNFEDKAFLEKLLEEIRP